MIKIKVDASKVTSAFSSLSAAAEEVSKACRGLKAACQKIKKPKTRKRNRYGK